MRRGSRVNSKKVSIPEEDEQERIRKAEIKKAIIKAEFEKHKKELKINVTEASKVNEIRLKNQLEELLVANEKKKQKLHRLENFEDNLDKQNMEATQFFETVSRVEVSKQSADAYLSVGYHPNRTTSSIFGMARDNTAEILSDKKAQLMETLANVELLLEQEDEVGGAVEDRYEELRKNQILLTKKVNELTKMNDHGGKRFTDLQRVEFLARTKQAAASSDLKELKDSLKDLKSQETAYKKQKEDEKRKDIEYLMAQQNEMANILIEIDKKRLELHQTKEDLKKLELRNEDMLDKRKNTAIVTKYIETLNALEEKRNPAVEVHQPQRDRSAHLSRDTSPQKSHSARGNRRHSLNVQTIIHEEDSNLNMKRNSVVDRNMYIEHIQKFYENHREGPEKYANNLIQEYLDQSYREQSLKGSYEELQNQKRKKEKDLNMLHDELTSLKGKNEYITRGVTGSKILDSNEQEAIDAGVFVMNSLHTTLNQAKFEFENQKDADNHTELFAKTEAFTMRCYLDSIEMITRLTKLLSSANHYSGGFLSEELKEALKAALVQISLLKRSKKKESSTSQTFSEAMPDLHRTHTDYTSVSDKEKEQEQIVTLDLKEVKDIFLEMFVEYADEASDFVEHIRNDAMITTFITIDDVKAYLQACQTEGLTESQVSSTAKKAEDLRKMAINNMLLKFETIYKVYTDLTKALQCSSVEVHHYLKKRGIEIQLGVLSRKEPEQTTFIKKAIEKKWKTLLERFNYDPTRDFRIVSAETQSTEQNLTINNIKTTEEADDHKEGWDDEDLRAKLNEIVGSSLKKGKSEVNTLFKGKLEEEQRRLQAKKEKEKEKQAVENMSDDEYLAWQRKQMKKENKEDQVIEANEGQILRKYQADQALRLSSQTSAPLEELKRMIENSRALSKIQILEKQKCSTDGKRTLKYEPVENYIPTEPKKVPKSIIHSGTGYNGTGYNIRITRNAFTPTSKPVGSRIIGTASERTTDFADSPKESYFKSSLRRPSKFRPQESQSDFSYDPMQENERTQTHGFKGYNNRDIYKKWSSEAEKNRSTSEDKQLVSIQSQQNINAPKVVKKKKLVIETMLKKDVSVNETKSSKNKSGRIDLPKLEKPLKKKKPGNKNKDSADKLSTDYESLNLFLNLQTDPLMKMVYSPTFFTTSFSGSAFSLEDMDYKFDSYKFKVPGLLISEKI